MQTEQSKRMTDLDLINKALEIMKRIKSHQQRVTKLSEKRTTMSGTTHTRTAIQNAEASLNFECMYLDQAKTDLARLYKNSTLDVGIGEKDYYPAPLHHYKH